MGCGGTKYPPDATYQRFSKSVKVLLLGTGESGKTTIIKQMKILHINGFSEKEKVQKIPYIKQNIHESIYDIVYNMDKIDPAVKLENPNNDASVQFILELGPDQPLEYEEEYFDHVKKLWKDQGIKKTFERSNEYQLIDSAQHFLNRIDDVRQPNYVPTLQDILFCRIRTTSISEIEFSLPVSKLYGGGTANILMYDVGGQRGERKKWIQVFEGINAILFIISASDFDQKLREDEKKNRLEEALTLFKDMCGSRFLREAGMIVFLNKQDVFQKKIERGRKLGKYFPEYENFSQKTYKSEFERAQAFLINKITELAEAEVLIKNIDLIKGTVIEEKLSRKDTYVHCTVATDTDHVKKVFDDVHEMIIKIQINKISSF